MVVGDRWIVGIGNSYDPSPVGSADHFQVVGTGGSKVDFRAGYCAVGLGAYSEFQICGRIVRMDFERDAFGASVLGRHKCPSACSKNGSVESCVIDRLGHGDVGKGQVLELGRIAVKVVSSDVGCQDISWSDVYGGFRRGGKSIGANA